MKRTRKQSDYKNLLCQPDPRYEVFLAEPHRQVQANEDLEKEKHKWIVKRMKAGENRKTRATARKRRISERHH